MALPSEEIKERLDIVQFLKDYLELRPAGRNLKALCPFHQEKTPSFVVSPERQIWHCFGCAKGGDIFKFLMEYENLEFYEALKVLAEKAGIELQKLSPMDQRQFGILYDINSAAIKFFSENLELSGKAREYLKERGLNKETIYEFELGFAPNNFDVLAVSLINEGFNMEDVVRAGLAFKTDRGKYIDRFRGRIMFPIHNHFGKVVGFSGRLLPELEKEDVGKYINSPETPIFNKSRLLYGFWKSKKAVREAKTVLLVEGQMDFLMLWQAGIKNVVATSGTSLSSDHLKVLKKTADNIVITFDKDEAGRAAAERAIDLSGAADLTVFILDFGQFKDPAEAIQSNTEFVIKALQNPTPAMKYYFEQFIPKEGAGKEDIRKALNKVKNLWSRIERANWIRELSHKTGIPTKDLSEELERIELREITKEEIAEQPANQINKSDLSRLEVIAMRILSLISIKKELHKLVTDKIEFMPTKYATAYEAIRKNSKDIDVNLSGLVNMIVLQSSLDVELDGEVLEKEINKLLSELELEHLKDKRKKVGQEIVMAEEDAGGEEGLIPKLKEFDELTRRMQDIENAKKEANYQN